MSLTSLMLFFLFFIFPVSPQNEDILASFVSSSSLLDVINDPCVTVHSPSLLGLHGLSHTHEFDYPFRLEAMFDGPSLADLFKK